MRGKLTLSGPASIAEARRRSLLLLSVFFFISGFAALIYQVVWQRLLTLHYGIGPISTAIVVSVFLAGMGIGGLVGGQIVERVTQRVLVYVAIELGIGAFGLASVPLLGAIGRNTAGAEYPVVLAISFAFLLVPTLLMGTTLPLLVRICSSLDNDFYRSISRLYFVNTLGAASGTVIAAYGLISFLGLDGALSVAACLNVLLATAVLALGQRLLTQSANGSLPACQPHNGIPSRVRGAGLALPAGFYLAFAVITGFIAIGYEIVWFRVVSAIVKNSAYSFASVLAIYLLGIALGSYYGPRLIARHRDRQPQMFFLLNAAVGVVAFAMMLFFYYGFQHEPLRLLGEAAGALYPHPYIAHGPLTTRELLKVIVSWGGLFGYPLLFVLLPTLLMGASFPLMTSLAYRGRYPGLTTGRVYCCSTLGNVLGGLITTFVLFPVLGTERTFLAFVLVGVGFVLLADIPGWLTGMLWRRAVLAAVLAVCAIAANPAPNKFYHLVFELLIRGPIDHLRAFDAEGPDGQSAIYTDGQVLYNTVNGVWHGVRPSPEFYAQVFASLSRTASTERVMMIGLGAGSYLEATLIDPRLKSVTVVELSGSMVRNFRNTPAVRRLMEDPRTELIVEDGRRMLMRRRDIWNVILMDPIRRQFAYAGNLYSYDFFVMLSKHLANDGVLLVKSQGDIQARTVAAAFPFVEELSCGVLIAGRAPKKLYPEWRERLVAALPRDFRKSVDDIECVPVRDRARILAETSELPVNTDLKPFGEYFLAIDSGVPFRQPLPPLPIE